MIDFENKTPEELQKIAEERLPLVLEIITKLFSRNIYNMEITKRPLLISGIGPSEETVIKIYLNEMDTTSINGLKEKIRSRVETFSGGIDFYGFACPIRAEYYRMSWERY
jgi:hypothetical protein